jgi:hypothetical protein
VGDRRPYADLVGHPEALLNMLLSPGAQHLSPQE